MVHYWVSSHKLHPFPSLTTARRSCHSVYKMSRQVCINGFTNYVPTLSVRRPCNVYWHVTAHYKLSFIIIIINRPRGSIKTLWYTSRFSKYGHRLLLKKYCNSIFTFKAHFCCIHDKNHRYWRGATVSAFISKRCVVRRTYSNYGDRCFAAAGPKRWNSLPADLRQADISFQRFQRLLKTFLFGCWDRGALWLTVKAAPHKFSYLLT